MLSLNRWLEDLHIKACFAESVSAQGVLRLMEVLVEDHNTEVEFLKADLEVERGRTELAETALSDIARKPRRFLKESC